jgi:7,8-dihydro-6-hydroxymethylpterin-pyrophosphokinase/isoprenylcysteine carboxyl methyltransferase (ICMT) family protein YpbQ
VGGPDQDPYLNAVMAVDSDAEPLEMLDLLQRIESDHGRTRTIRWGPRTLDLDIVAWEGPEFTDARLTVPHPRAHERSFVLKPLAELWPDANVGHGRSALDALQEVGDDGVDFLARDWLPPVSRLVPNLLVTGQFLLFGAVGVGVIATGTVPSGVDLGVILGGVAILTGAALALWSAQLLGSAMTASPVPVPQAAMVDSGPYSVVRHPIYTGVCLTMIGLAGLFGSWPAGIMATALVPYLWFKTGYEERQLRLRFPDYRAYRRDVPWRLIPYVT